MKKIITLLIFLITTSLVAQDTYTQADSEKFDKQANKITNAYNKQLAMTNKQFVLFQKKVEEFLITREKIETNFSGKEKLAKLYNMQNEETAEMRDILTQPQMDLYVEIKNEIQPLATVENKR